MIKLATIREKQKADAAIRLHMLEKLYTVHPNVLKEFKQNRTIYYSERINKTYDGILYWLKNKPEYVEAVKEIEKKYEIFIYHCILTHTHYGDWLTMLFVSNEPENWAEEKSRLMVGYPEAYVYDFTEFNSEFGTIEIKGVNGGLARAN